MSHAVEEVGVVGERLVCVAPSQQQADAGDALGGGWPGVTWQCGEQAEDEVVLEAAIQPPDDVITTGRQGRRGW